MKAGQGDVDAARRALVLRTFTLVTGATEFEGGGAGARAVSKN